MKTYTISSLDQSIRAYLEKHPELEVKEFLKPKKRGGFRTIIAPSDELKAIQKVALACLRGLSSSPSSSSIGFVPKTSRHSLQSRLWPTINSGDDLNDRWNKLVLVRIDIKDAFENTGSESVRDLLSWEFKGYEVWKEGAHSTFGQYPGPLVQADKNTLDKWRQENYDSLVRITTWKSHTPIGFPTSPFLFDMSMRRIDAGICSILRGPDPEFVDYCLDILKQVDELLVQPSRPPVQKVVYCRYADDLIFLLDESLMDTIGNVISIIESNGYPVNRKKIRISRFGRGRKVLGLVLDDSGKYGVRVGRDLKNKVRGLIHNFVVKREFRNDTYRDKINGLISCMDASTKVKFLPIWVPIRKAYQIEKDPEKGILRLF